MVAAQAEEIANAQPGRADGIGRDGYPGAVARLKLHHRLQAALQRIHTGG
jgi:hypothetical protein